MDLGLGLVLALKTIRRLRRAGFEELFALRAAKPAAAAPLPLPLLCFFVFLFDRPLRGRFVFIHTV